MSGVDELLPIGRFARLSGLSIGCRPIHPTWIRAGRVADHAGWSAA